MNAPVCKECSAEGAKSRVYRGPGITTCMGISEYWDEDGNYHFHDPNYTTWQCSCSRGHEWGERTKRVCPTCGEAA